MSQQIEDKPRRPILRYHGGKWRLAPWIISHFPKHTRYVEPYCGGASLLLKKDRAYAEIINDIDGQIVNLFRVIKNEICKNILIDDLALTPYSRTEFENAKIYEDYNQIERARRFLIRSHMGFNPAALNTGFRSNSNRTSSIPAHNWADIPQVIEATAARLKGVIIESRPAVEVIKKHDCKDTIIFADPPYLPDVRSPSSQYVNDMDYDDHYNMIAVLHDLKGMVVLCGYASYVYEDGLERYGWLRVEKQTFTAQKQKRTECLWLNPHCQQRLKANQ